MGGQDAAAFRELYCAHYRTVCRYLMARADPDVVEDVAAETFLVAWRRQADLPATVVPWLLNTARKVLANQRRSARRADALVERIAAVTAGASASVEDALGRNFQRRALVSALSGMRERDREILILRHWDELPPRDIAVVLEARSVVVRTRLHRAERRLREAFAEALEDEEGAPAALALEST